MPFKVPPKRATVSQDFIDLWFDWMKRSFLKMKSEVDHGGMVKEAILRKNRPTMARIMNLMKNRNVLDLELTRLRSFNYESFDVETYDGVTFWKAVTRRVEMIVDDNYTYDMKRGKHDIYDIGQYAIYIPKDIDAQGINAPNIHFIPLEDPLLVARTPHHVAGGGLAYVGNRAHIVESHPLKVSTATCWGGGGFPAVMAGIVKEAAIVDLFANAHVFLSRCNTASLLARPFEWAAPHKKFLRSEKI